MPSKAAEICATVGATILLSGALVATAIFCPEAFVPTKVRVVAPIPYVIPTSHPTEIRLPSTYKHRYVVYNGLKYDIFKTPDGDYYVYGGIQYPIYYY